jgi:RNA 2',3'-cyclic 3'-phosphodiesterase
MTAQVRLFVAVAPPGATATAAARVIARLKGRGVEARWVDPAQAHLTLHFLGDVEETLLPACCRALDMAAGRVAPFEIEIGGVGGFPDPRRPRTIWLGVRRGAEGLRALHESLATELVPLGFRPEGRRFVPHVTLGRVRPGGGVDLADEFAKLADVSGGGGEVASVTLVASRLEPRGAVHDVLHEADLTAG